MIPVTFDPTDSSVMEGKSNNDEAFLESDGAAPEVVIVREAWEQSFTLDDLRLRSTGTVPPPPLSDSPRRPSTARFSMCWWTVKDARGLGRAAAEESLEARRDSTCRIESLAAEDSSQSFSSLTWSRQVSFLPT